MDGISLLYSVPSTHPRERATPPCPLLPIRYCGIPRDPLASHPWTVYEVRATGKQQSHSLYVKYSFRKKSCPLIDKNVNNCICIRKSTEEKLSIYLTWPFCPSFPYAYTPSHLTNLALPTFCFSTQAALLCFSRIASESASLLISRKWELKCIRESTVVMGHQMDTSLCAVTVHILQMELELLKGQCHQKSVRDWYTGT